MEIVYDNHGGKCYGWLTKKQIARLGTYKPRKVPKTPIISRKKKKKGVYPSEYKRISKEIRAEKKVCEKCGGKEYLMLHHKDRDKHNNSRGNLILLCFNCHKLHHKHLRVPSFMK